MKNLSLSLSLLCLALCAASVANAAPKRLNNKFYVFDNCASLTAAACDVTIQQPASGSQWVEFVYAQVYCSVACVLTISRDGTAATGTGATENSLNGGVTATAVGFIDSDAGAGTTVQTINIAAGATIGISLDGIVLEDNNTTSNNLTLATNEITGDASVYLLWAESSR